MDTLAVTMFWVSSVLILPFWIMLWFMPKHELTKRFVGDIRCSILPLLIPYAILALRDFAYRIVSRNRHRVFRRPATCVFPR